MTSTSHRPSGVRVRPADAARLALGGVLLAAPGTVAAAADSPNSMTVRGTVRVLGARYLLQALAAPVVQRAWVRPVDTGVDLVHAASMLAFARAFPTHRRLAQLSAVTALVFAALDAAEATR